MTWDFLKGILPDSIIKIFQDNRKIEIKNSVIISGQNTISDENVIKQILDKISEKSKEESLPFQLVHKDLIEDFIEYENISIREKSNLHLLKEVLLIDDVECIMMARRIVLAYDKKEIVKAEELLNQLEKNYPKKGKKVFNLISAKYFDEMILPFIEVFKVKHGIDKYVEEYRKFYSDLLKFFPIGIFVGNNVTENKIKERLIQRLELKDIPFIRIHSIGDNNIQKVENVIKQSEIDKHYITKDERFTTPSGLKAQIYEITIKLD